MASLLSGCGRYELGGRCAIRPNPPSDVAVLLIADRANVARNADDHRPDMRFAEDERARLKDLAEGRVLAGVGSEAFERALRKTELAMGAAGLEPATSRV
jgi:hypothetical protein